MSGLSASRRGARLLVAFQVLLIVATLFAPIPVAAADDPPADPPPSAEPTPTPTADPTPEPTPDPTPEASPVATPTIASDQADYGPGDLVTLNGNNWQPGESVHIFVNDDWGSSWSRNVDVVADAGGTIVDQFNLPDWFVATYSVVATGAESGSASTTFTDGNFRIKAAPSGVFTSLTWVRHADNLSCTASAANQTSGSDSSVGNANSNDFSGGVAATDSLFVTVADVANTGEVFTGWTGASFIAQPDPHSICVPGDFTGTRTYVANYAANTAPVANNDAYTVAEDGTLVVAAPGVLTNDTDANSNPLTVGTPRPASGPSNGSLTLNANGSFTYSPNADFIGVDSFTYWANDGFTNSASTANVTITVTPVDDAPIAVDDSATVSEDSGANSIDVLANDTDVDAGPKTVDSVSQPTNGSVVNNGTDVSYTPAADYCGLDSFTYTLNGGSTATVSLTVTCVDDAPVAVNDSATVNEDSGANAIDVLANDTDIDGGPKTVDSVTAPTNGSVVNNGTDVSYTPAADYCGPDSFSYTLNGGSSATVSVTVTCVNDNPVATDDAVLATEDTPETIPAATLLGNDTDTEGDTLFISAVGTPIGGTVVLNGDGSVTFTPAADLCGIGVASFEYTVNDGNGGTDIGAVTVQITCVDDAPVAVNDSATVNEDSGANAIDVLANDTDIDGGPKTVASVTAPTNGSVVNNGTDVSYTPAADYCGPDSFSYTLNGGSSATVSVTVTCVNDNPVATDDSATVAEDSGATAIDVLANDNDGPDTGETLTVIGASDPANGTVTFTPTGVSYTPDPDYYGADAFTYEISDGNGGTATATVNVTVTEVNDPADAVDDASTLPEDSPLTTIDVEANDSTGPANEASQSLSVTSVSDPANGTAMLVDTGTPTNTADDYVQYMPDPDYFGPDSFTYTVCDNGTTNGVADSSCDTATVNITVTSVNDAPVVTLVGPASANEGQTQSYSFSVTDVDSTSFSLVSQSCGANGTLSNAAFNSATGAGSFDCTFPDGPASSIVAVQVEDSDGAPSNTDTITVAIANVAPVVSLVGANSADEGQTESYTFTVSDPGDDTFSLVSQSCGANGTLSNAAFNSATGAGSFDCTFPDGPASSIVAVQVEDSDGAPSNTDTITVAIANVAPVVSLVGANSADEGQTESYTFTVSDPGDDTFSLVSQSCGANGTLSNAAFNSATGAGSFDCTFPDGPASSIVAVQVEDSDGAPSNTDTITVAIANVAPVVSLVGANSADEGQTESYTFTVSDPGDDTFSLVSQSCGANGTLSNAAFNSATGAGSFDCTFPDGPASSIVAVQVEDSDGAPSNTDTITVAIANVAPVVSLVGANSADEGQTESYTFTVSDPGDDTFSLVSQSCGANGTLSNAAFNSATGAGSFDCTFPDGPASSIVAVQVEDSDGAPSNTDTITVAIANVAPVVSLVGANSADEGQTESYTFTVSDPGDDTFSLVSQSCGANGTLSNAAFNSATGAGSFDCTFPDGPASSIVAVQVEDSDGAPSNTDTITVAIANVAPVVSLVGANSADEGQTESYTFTVSDPGDDTFSLVSQSCGANGTLSNAAFNSATGAGSFDCTFPDGPASSIVAVQVEDSDGAPSNTDTITVAIANVAPANVTATASPSTINESDSTTVSGTFTDPGTLDTHTVVISWGDGSSNTTINLPAGVLTFSASHQYRDDNPTVTSFDIYSVSVTVTDDDGESAIGGTTVRVNNVAPVITSTSGPAGPQQKGTPTTVSATYTDVGTQDTHTCTFAWDDSTPTTTVPGSGGTCTATHTYAAAGVYAVSVTVKDDDSGEDTEIFTTYVVIYDPGAGFVTGGGWINVTPGSCTLTPSCTILSGKANFGFNSKYKKGASVPDGQTEFQFHAGGINFHSEAYEWLVINGHKAQYRGTGEINGTTGYGFILTAYDGNVSGGGGVDKFRIKIWRVSTGEVVFDSKMGTSDDIDAANPQAIAGGSIVIHK